MNGYTTESAPARSIRNCWRMCLGLAVVMLASCASPKRVQEGPRPLEIGMRVEPADVDVKPEWLSMNEPEYPENARAQGIEGTVYFDVLVDEAGHIKELQMTKGVDPSLDESATTAMRSAKLKPATKNGVPVAVWIRDVPMEYKLHK